MKISQNAKPILKYACDNCAYDLSFASTVEDIKKNIPELSITEDDDILRSVYYLFSAKFVKNISCDPKLKTFSFNVESLGIDFIDRH